MAVPEFPRGWCLGYAVGRGACSYHVTDLVSLCSWHIAALWWWAFSGILAKASASSVFSLKNYCRLRNFCRVWENDCAWTKSNSPWRKLHPISRLLWKTQKGVVLNVIRPLFESRQRKNKKKTRWGFAKQWRSGLLLMFGSVSLIGLGEYGCWNSCTP